MKLSVIIPTKGRREIFATTLAAAVLATRHLNAEIIVVNDSKEESPDVPQEQNITLLNNPRSGVAAARNFGFSNSSGELILFLDNDIIITRESIDHVMNLHDNYPNACFNLNWEYSPDILKKIPFYPFTRFLKRFQMISFKGWYNDPTWKDNQLFVSKSIASFHLSISRADFKKTGGYHEGFPFAGFEDYDFPFQLKKAGIAFYIDSRVTVCHNEIDRLDLDNWLNNQQNRACTRKKAVTLGYDELTIQYSFWKSLILNIIAKNEFVLKLILRMVPNSTITDPFYFKMLSILQASRIYRGYSTS